MSVSLKCIERLVLTRNRYALSEVSFSMLIKAVLLEFHQGIYVDTCKNNLHSILPQWVEMNDALYWHSVEDARKNLVGTISHLIMTYIYSIGKITGGLKRLTFQEC